MEWYSRYLCYFLGVCLLGLYIRLNDQRLQVLPPELEKLSPKRLSLEDVRAEAKKLDSQESIASKEVLPPKTGRRYIVVGGVSNAFRCCSHM